MGDGSLWLFVLLFPIITGVGLLASAVFAHRWSLGLWNLIGATAPVLLIYVALLFSLILGTSSNPLGLFVGPFVLFLPFCLALSIGALLAVFDRPVTRTARFFSGFSASLAMAAWVLFSNGIVRFGD
ncbi:MAG: hypothetical protein AAAFM81_01630 [Pseudomonadota bacterium]